MNNPQSETFIGWERQMSGLEIPDKEHLFYLERRVPRGEVRMKTYFAKTTQSFRTAFVYTPPGYDSSRDRYPVLYLQHGSGEDASAWTKQGHAQVILDNLLADKAAVPMLIVMETGYALKPDAMPEDGKNLRGNESFGQLVVSDLIPMVDANFRTLATRQGRAIAGLSMGGGQAAHIGMDNPTVFSAVASLSGGADYLAKEAFLSNAKALNGSMQLLWLGCGQQDFGYKRAQQAHDVMTTAGLNHVWFDLPGDHEWQVWRKSLHDLLPRLFRPKHN
jgi:enterochelin esterase family protein